MHKRTIPLKAGPVSFKRLLGGAKLLSTAVNDAHALTREDFTERD